MSLLRYEGFDAVAKFCKIEVSDVKAYISNGTFGVSSTSANRIEMQTVYAAMSTGARSNPGIIDKIVREEQEAEALQAAKDRAKQLEEKITQLESEIDLGDYEFIEHPALH